jgi:hypothetical protein
MCVVFVGLLAGCGNDECSAPRRGDEQTCDSYDGGQLTFALGEHVSDVRAFCASPCLDVFAPVAISGYSDLRMVPLLPKLRQVQKVSINIDTLHDLRGLEKVDVLTELSLNGRNGDTTRKTFEGLSDEEMGAFTLEQVSGVASLEGASVKRLEVFAARSSSLHSLDLSAAQVAFMNVDANESLRSLTLPSGEMTQLWIQRNPQLSELTWRPDLTVRKNLLVDSNQSLSSCVVQQLVEQTDAGVRRTEFIRNNGPCP